MTKTLDRTGSKMLARMIRAETGKCWKNSVRCFLAHVPCHIMPVGSVYVEGWALLTPTMPIPTEHGWIETPDNRILDPTIALLGFDKNLIASAYIGGVRYERQQVFACLTTNPVPPFIWKGHGFGGFRHAGYLAAFNEALRIGSEEASNAT